MQTSSFLKWQGGEKGVLEALPPPCFKAGPHGKRQNRYVAFSASLRCAEKVQEVSLPPTTE